MDKRDMFESLIKDALEESELETIIQSDCFPQHVISGSGWGWFLDPESMQMIRTKRGVEVVPVSEEADSNDRMLVQTMTRLLLIPESEILEIGWN